MNAEETVDLLNEAAGKELRTSPRKRARAPDDQSTSPNKRRELSSSSKANAGNGASSGTVSKLQRRKGLPSSQLKSNRGDLYELAVDPDSPIAQKMNRAPTTKKIRLLRKATQDKDSPLKGYEHGSVDPTVNKNVKLTTYDSPSKRTRSKTGKYTEHPLKTHNEQLVAPKLELNKSANLNAKTPAKRLQHRASEEADTIEVRHNKGNQNQSRSTRLPEITLPVDSGRSPGFGKGDAVTTQQQSQKQQNATSAAITDKQSPPQGRKSRPTQETENEKAHRERLKRDKKQKDAEATRENAKLTEEAEKEAYDVRSTHFMKDIKHMATEMQLFDVWATLGASALMIERKTNRKAEIKSKPVHDILGKIHNLRDMYAEYRQDRDPSSLLSHKIANTVQNLKISSAPTFFDQDRSDKAYEIARREMYEHLIPYCVRALKSALKSRYDNGLSRSFNLEMLKLTNVAINLCDIPRSWEVESSLLEPGIASYIRNGVKPSLVRLSQYFDGCDYAAARDEWQKEETERLRKAQIEAQAARRQRAQLLRNNYHRRVMLSANSNTIGVVNIDEILPEEHFNGSTHLDAPILTKHPPMERQRTEEIPAPDPVTLWTEEENIALLNGLQLFLGIDRYERILDTYPQLRQKDLDQLISRAQFFKQACGSYLTHRARKDDHSMDWLQTVVG